MNNNTLPVRNIVGLIVFDGEKFLILHRKLNWKGWEYPKGGIEEGETHEEAIKRELWEETGLERYELIGKISEFEFIDKARNRKGHTYNYLLRVPSTAVVKINNEHVLDKEIVLEHDDFKWCLPKEAIKLLTHKDMKISLKKALDHLGIESK
ncbi:MAG TPA: NUDIX domain-containing protein [archaeon]|nr:NUDIX domain-containing protein [archaeon]